MASSVGYATVRVARTSFAEEFMKLAKLKERGILSEQEFNEMKAALISQAKGPTPVSGDMQVVRAGSVSDGPVAIPTPVPTRRSKAPKKGLMLMIAVVAGFAAYSSFSRQYETRQDQETAFAADSKRQAELMKEARLIADATPQQMIDMHNAEEAAKRDKVQRTAVAATAVTGAADAQFPKETDNGKYMAEAACKDAVQASLSNPGSAEFLDTGVKVIDGGKYLVTVVLRPKGAFGALIRGTSHCVVLPDSFQVASITDK